MDPTLEELTELLIEFRDARDWKKFHSLKNLMLSLTLESAEILELVQWHDDDTVESMAIGDAEFRARLAEECADVFLYLLLVCERAGIDLKEAAIAKIELNARKYPVERSRGSSKKYTDL